MNTLHTLALSGFWLFQAGTLVLLHRATRNFGRALRQPIRKTYKLRAAFTLRPVWQEGSTMACHMAQLINPAGRAIAKLLFHDGRYCPYRGGAEFDEA